LREWEETTPRFFSISKMKILLVTIGSAGDVLPFVGLGVALRRRGDAVTVATGEPFAHWVQEAGLDFIKLGSAASFEAILDNPDLWHPSKGFKIVFEQGVLPLMRPTYHIVREFCRDPKAVVVAHAIAFGARIAQEELGLPLATVHLAPVALWSRHESPRYPGLVLPSWLGPGLKQAIYDLISALVVDPLLTGKINAFRREKGLPPVRHILQRWWNSPRRIIALFPSWFGPPQADWPQQTRLASFPLYDAAASQPCPPELTAFLQAGQPPVIATFGSAMKHAGPQFAAVVEACRQLRHRAVLLTPHAAQLPPHLPDGIRHFPYAPFGELFPRAAALFHHGGIGTTAQALATALPQAVMPLSHDQYDNAARVQRLGAGYRLRTVAPAAVVQTLTALLQPSIRQRCRQIAGQFATDRAMDQACRWIEELGHSEPERSSALHRPSERG
jgi:UDP:flavonoid glycosyltransferase YjiC (YdhE family)